ncbi:MAG TPA: 16S rRNA (uracil(1498)-N(3))-methyltransferase [Myxococcaceae bacterium]|nr:16S rRNA (uracil(1498)-N(3))-methyltransferase [Myxococcaceae bacterium]
MNLLLLQPEDFREDGTVHLTGRRAAHAREVLRAQEGSSLRVGRRDGQVGRATVLANDVDGLHLDICLESPPPPRAGVTLILAIPRPKALKKVLPAVASLGVDRVFLVNAARVEKSYFDSHVLRPESVETLFGLGLEQARDTVAPELHLRPRFRPFVEDELPGRLDGVPLRLLPHPTAEQPLQALPQRPWGPAALAIGPEGGWVPFEVDLLSRQGFLPVSLGPRILRVEVAVPLLLGQLELLRCG